MEWEAEQNYREKEERKNGTEREKSKKRREKVKERSAISHDVCLFSKVEALFLISPTRRLSLSFDLLSSRSPSSLSSSLSLPSLSLSTYDFFKNV